MSLVDFRKAPHWIDVHFSNGVYLGELSIADDGFYVFWPDTKGGYWDQMVLSEIVAKLEELNKPWQEEIDRYFSTCGCEGTGGCNSGVSEPRSSSDRRTN